jgi:hypothetical protein
MTVTTYTLTRLLPAGDPREPDTFSRVFSFDFFSSPPRSLGPGGSGGRAPRRRVTTGRREGLYIS